MDEQKRILLIDLDDVRRDTRVRILQRAGHDVDVRTDHVEAATVADEGEYDMVVIALHLAPKRAIAYTAELREHHPNLPVLLLTDAGVYAPLGSRSNSGANPLELLADVAQMLTGSSHVRELPRLV